MQKYPVGVLEFDFHMESADGLFSPEGMTRRRTSVCFLLYDKIALHQQNKYLSVLFTTDSVISVVSSTNLNKFAHSVYVP